MTAIRSVSVLLPLVAAAALYAAGVRRRQQRHPDLRRAVTDAACFYGGLALVAVALLPPVDRVADELFWVHMTQHLLIGLAGPLFVVCGRPVTVMSGAVSGSAQRELHRMVSRWRRTVHFHRSSVGWALVAVSAHVVAFWAWHAPPVYDAAVQNDVLHAFEHATLFVTGALFWWVVVAVRWRERSGAAVLYLFVAGFASGALAALLTLAPHALYSVHATTTAAWHLTPLEDQQLAGAVMWVPGGSVYVAAAVVLFVRWLGAAPASEWALGRRSINTACVVVLTIGIALLAGCGGSGRVGRGVAVPFGDGEAGRTALRSYGCGSCHTIPGVDNANAAVGPPLNRFGDRSFIAGELDNTPDNLVRWIMDPKGVEPGTAMPDLDVSREDAQNIAAYLESLH